MVPWLLEYYGVCSLLFLLLWQDAIQLKGGEADLACSPEDAVHPVGMHAGLW